MGTINENGDHLTITETRQEVEEQKAAAAAEQGPSPQTAPPQPADTDPGIKVDNDVDEAWVEEAGKKVLPDSAASHDYRTRSAEGEFRQLANVLVSKSMVDLDAFAKELGALITQVVEAEKKLNAKSVPSRSKPQLADYEPLPGIAQEEVCTSQFDANDLALRGRKAVSVRQFSQPLVMFDSQLENAAAPEWLFGEKLEYQQEWRHEAFTLGELVTSMSLLPTEELTIEVSSYQRTRQEIETISDDTVRTQLAVEQRNTDERSCTNQTAQDNGWTVAASASISYPVASASIDATAYGNSSQQAEQSRRELIEATRRSSSDVSSRRAVKVTQTSESGSQATTTRRLKNQNACQTVTYNFFQVMKLYDLQLRLIGDRPVILLPAIFPRAYGPKEVRTGETLDVRPTAVEIPAYLVEGLRSPAAFLSRYFDVDRDLSRQISGWALRLRGDIGADPLTSMRLFAEALVVAAIYLFKADVVANMDRLAAIFEGYCSAILETGRRSANAYGPDKGATVQLNTPGVYVDALRGRCIACADHEEARQYVGVMTDYEELRRLTRANALDDQEIERREKRLGADDLTPFVETP